MKDHEYCKTCKGEFFGREDCLSCPFLDDEEDYYNNLSDESMNIGTGD